MEEQQRDYIPDGERDNALTKYAGFLRGPLGMSESAIKTAIDLFLENGLVEQPEGREMTSEDAERIAHSISRHETELPKPISTRITQGVAFDLPMMDWYLYGFILKGGYLMTGYAPGGTGKSSFGQYIAALVTQAGDNFLVINHEDTPQYWKVCAVASGADRTRLYSHNSPLSLKLPGCIEELEEIVKNFNIKFIWFDSIKDHMPTGKNGTGDAQDNARAGLSPLADLATRTGCAIFGVFHTNKKGLPGGSTSFMDVARHVLAFKREKSDTLNVTVDKTNINRPDYALRMKGAKKPLVDPRNPESKALEKLEDGSIILREEWITDGYEKDSDLLKQLEQGKEDSLILEQIQDLMSQGVSQRKIAEALGTNQTKINRLLGKVKDKINLENLY